MASQRDPVCGMQVSEQNAAAKSQYQGETYYFCSQDCKEQFDQNPQQYARGQAQRSGAGGGMGGSSGGSSGGGMGGSSGGGMGGSSGGGTSGGRNR